MIRSNQLNITPADFCDSPWQEVPLDRVEGIVDSPPDRLARFCFLRFHPFIFNRAYV
ncbi:hypothetical protein [Thermosporothrix hazakensis]|uniref:hypothetical protein n=1 Tax=Thermosporothrix hazakensis TaxID=644383 RepID=UPI0014764D28|nr:hypothetical protein [Thermosporothrix hazakensis]